MRKLPCKVGQTCRADFRATGLFRRLPMPRRLTWRPAPVIALLRRQVTLRQTPQLRRGPLEEIEAAIQYETQQAFTDSQGRSTRFSPFLAEQLGRIQGLQAYHQKDLAHLLSQAKLYTLMGTAERAQYLEETHAFVRSVQWRERQAPAVQPVPLQVRARRLSPHHQLATRVPLPSSPTNGAPSAPAQQVAPVAPVNGSTAQHSAEKGFSLAPPGQQPRPSGKSSIHPDWRDLNRERRFWEMPSMQGGPGEALAYLQHTTQHAFVVLDIETTGFLTSSGRMIELVGYAYRSREVFDSGVINVFPFKSSEGALAAHGITNQEIHSFARPKLESVAPAFVDFCQRQAAGCSSQQVVLVAYNGKSFDFKYVVKDFALQDITLPPDWRCLDPKIMASSRLRNPGPIKFAQANLREWFNVPVPKQVHRALPDVQILAQILPHLLHAVGLQNADAALEMPEAFNSRMGDTTGKGMRASVAGGTGKAKAQAAKASGQKQLDILRTVQQSPCGEDDPITDIESSSESSSSLRWTRGPSPSQPASQPGTAAAPPPPPPADSAAKASPKPRGRPPKAKTAVELATPAASELPSSVEQAVDHARGSDDERVGQQQAMHWSQRWRDALQAAEQACPALNTDVAAVASLKLTKAQGRDLKEAGLGTLWGLLQHYPREHVQLHDTLQEGQLVQVSGTVARTKSFTTPSIQGFEAWVDMPSHSQAAGELGQTRAQVHIKKIFSGYKGSYAARMYTSSFPKFSEVVLRGKARCSQPAGPSAPAMWELEGGSVSISALDPTGQLAGGMSTIYSARTPMSAEQFDTVMPKAVQELQQLQAWEPLPQEVRTQHELMPWAEAVAAMHKPEDLDAGEEARRRLAFDELLSMQLQLLLQRDLSRMPRADEPAMCMSNQALMQAARQVLPFQLTPAQDRALAQISNDLLGSTPMLRLLQGDVGCGKTVVAFMALLTAVGSGYQGAMLAPTEVLAEQHMRKLGDLLARLPEGSKRPTAAMLTGSTKAKERRAVLEGLASGAIDLVVGTHAVINAPVVFSNLGLGVIDEQHRFGVEQRSALAMKNSPPPHMLAMTATPIPRTLALVAHGDLAHSAIDEMPSGRIPVATSVRRNNKEQRRQLYKSIREDLKTGGRTFIVCPLVEASTNEATAHLHAATEEQQRLKEEKAFGPEVQMGLLHGRLTSAEKASALQAFADGSTPVLIATSVVEVGVDVPEASIMVVMGAERFGLAQLHQMRGRVGRSSRASQCFLLTTPAGEERLQVLEQSNNGFHIAQADLMYRGAGEVFGRKQSGREHWTQLRAARLPDDGNLLEAARATAAELLSTYSIDPSAWPQPLLGAMAYSRLPNLDFYELPEHALGSPDRTLDAG